MNPPLLWCSLWWCFSWPRTTTAFPLSVVAMSEGLDDSSEEASKSEKESISRGPQAYGPTVTREDGAHGSMKGERDDLAACAQPAPEAWVWAASATAARGGFVEAVRVHGHRKGEGGWGGRRYQKASGGKGRWPMEA